MALLQINQEETRNITDIEGSEALLKIMRDNGCNIQDIRLEEGEGKIKFFFATGAVIEFTTNYRYCGETRANPNYISIEVKN